MTHMTDKVEEVRELVLAFAAYNSELESVRKAVAAMDEGSVTIMDAMIEIGQIGVLNGYIINT